MEGHAELTAMLMPEGYKARAEQAILFTFTAWDVNCPQHIPQRFDATDVAAAFAERDKRIETLEAELKQLRLLRNSGVRYDERSVPRREIGIRTGPVADCQRRRRNFWEADIRSSTYRTRSPGLTDASW